MFNQSLKYIITHPQTISPILVRTGRDALIRVNQLTQQWRTLPNFLIIGAQKSGTTSLYKYVAQHPQVVPAYKKEIYFFNTPQRYGRGLGYYRAHFPTHWTMNRPPQPRLTGEASPEYLFHPLAAQRVQAAVPHAKFLVLLRNPVARAYSHYQHMVRAGQETRTFEDALAREWNLWGDEWVKFADDGQYHNVDYWLHAYASHSLYARQVARWLALFPREQFLFIKSERFFTEPAAVCAEVFTFLGLPAWQPPQGTFKPFNAGSYADMSAATVRQLADYFAPHNQALYAHLGVDWQWELELETGL